jgi:hypothetical protein
MSALEGEISEGLFAETVAYSIISMTTVYVFLPLWIFVFIGTELTNGHTNRAVFLSSRKSYFISKLIYSALVAVLFTVIGVVTFIISVNTSPYLTLSATPAQVIFFGTQLLLFTLTYAGFLLSIIFFIRKPMMTFVVYFVWSLIESIVFMPISKLYHIKLAWLPLHIIQALYSVDGENRRSENYHNPVIDNPLMILSPVLFVFALLMITYRIFLKRDLMPLSD